MNIKKPKIGGAVYILPNLLTTGNLYFGYFSIVKSLQLQFGWAAAAIFIASIFDVLDGRVARLTKSTSEFGVQYDSLCDLVSFGLAPAFLMYQFGLNDMGRLGWIVCFVFLACGALRLARFNVQSSIGQGNDDFTGLPIPMAATVPAVIVALIVTIQSPENAGNPLYQYLAPYFLNETIQKLFLLVLAPSLGLLMVSNVAYRSHKSLRISGVKPFRMLAIFIMLIALLAYEPEFIGFVFLFGYAISGPLEWLLGWKKAKEDDDIFSTDETEE
jgi:CDP-diacylglycerol--serine O-phosphatidyltransferase